MSDQLPFLAPTDKDVTFLGPVIAISSATGPRSKEEILHDSFDPERDAREMDEFGWLASYFNTWSTSSPDSPVVITAGVNLFETPEGAVAAIADDIEDLESDVGKSNGSSKLLSAGAVKTESAPSGAAGVVFALDPLGYEEPEYEITLVGFPAGRLYGVAGLVSGEPGVDLLPQAAELANLLYQRIEMLLDSD